MNIFTWNKPNAVDVKWVHHGCNRKIRHLMPMTVRDGNTKASERFSGESRGARPLVKLGGGWLVCTSCKGFPGIIYCNTLCMLTLLKRLWSNSFVSFCSYYQCFYLHYQIITEVFSYFMILIWLGHYFISVNTTCNVTQSKLPWKQNHNYNSIKKIQRSSRPMLLLDIYVVWARFLQSSVVLTNFFVFFVVQW